MSILPNLLSVCHFLPCHATTPDTKSTPLTFLSSSSCGCTSLISSTSPCLPTTLLPVHSLTRNYGCEYSRRTDCFITMQEGETHIHPNPIHLSPTSHSLHLLHRLFNRPHPCQQARLHRCRPRLPLDSTLFPEFCSHSHPFPISPSLRPSCFQPPTRTSDDPPLHTFHRLHIHKFSSA